MISDELLDIPSLREKCPNAEFLFSPNTGKYGPEKTPYLDTFHAVLDVIKERADKGTQFVIHTDFI